MLLEQLDFRMLAVQDFFRVSNEEKSETAQQRPHIYVSKENMSLQSSGLKVRCTAGRKGGFSG